MIDKKDIIFEFEKSYSISYNNHYLCCVGGGKVNIYDAVSGIHIFNINSLKQACFSQFSTDERLFVKAIGGYFIYNLCTFDLEKRIPRPSGVKRSSYQFTLTPDNKYIIDFAEAFPNEKLLIIDVETGKSHLYDFGSARVSSLFYDNCKSKYYIATRTGDYLYKHFCSLYYSFDSIFDINTFEIQKLPFSYDDYSKITFNHGIFAYAKYNGEIEIFDVDSKNEDILQYVNNGVLYDMKLSQNGRYIAIAQSRMIQIIDITAKQVVKSFDVDSGCFVDFYDNDAKLLIGTWEKGYCVDISSVIKDQASFC